MTVMASTWVLAIASNPQTLLYAHFGEARC